MMARWSVLGLLLSAVLVALTCAYPVQTQAESPPDESGYSARFPTGSGATGHLWTGTTVTGSGPIGTNLPDAVSALFHWNNVQQRFDFWFRGFPESFQTLLEIVPGGYYFFQSSTAVEVAVPGDGTYTLPPPGGGFFTAAAGATGQVWTGCPVPLTDVATLPSAVSAVFRWSNTQQRFDFWFRGFPEGFQTLHGGIIYADYAFFQAAAQGVFISTPACVVPNPIPTITSLSPSPVTAGAAGFTLTVNGNGFFEGSTVKWNGSSRSTTYVSSVQITASIPASDVLVPALVNISVTNPPPGGGDSNVVGLDVQAPAICAGANAEIIALDKVAEIVTVFGSGDLTGWYLISVNGNQRFDFPDGFVAGGQVQIISSTPQFPNTANALWWTSGNIWNNSTDDDAALFNCLDQQVDYFDDGS